LPVIASVSCRSLDRPNIGAKDNAVPGKTLVEGEDFYYEGPYMVFTEKFLRERGYCCESGCRHCPWGFRGDVRSDEPGDDEGPGGTNDER
jgi:hypothetical protein